MNNERQPEEIPLEALVQFTHYVRFVSCDPAKNRNRFYLLTWQPALDGSSVLVCTWGRMHTHGRSRMLCSADQPSAQATITRVIRRRLQRGYHVMEWH